MVADKPTGLERESLVIRGVRSELTLDGGVITIVKEATTQAHPTTVTIDVSTVRGSTVETPKRGGRGWFHVASTNGSPAPVGELAATGDPYALPITGRQVGACRKLARMIDRHVRERGLPTDVGPNQGRFGTGVVVTGSTATVPAAPATKQEPAAEPARTAAEPKDAKATKAAAAAAKTTKKRTTKKPAAKKAVRNKPAGTAPKAAPAPAPERTAAASELVGQLRELGELHAAGVLDDEEFAAAKARILG